MENPSYENEFDFHENEPAGGIHVHNTVQHEIFETFILRIGDFLGFAGTNFLRLELTEISVGN